MIARTILISLFVVGFVPTQAGTRNNPFAQPTASELKTAVLVMRADSRFSQKARIIGMTLAEPSKKEYYDSVLRPKIAREIFCVAFDASSNHTYEFRVDVQKRTVTEVRTIPSVQPMLSKADYDSAESVLRNSPRFTEIMRRRGVAPDSVAVETWASGVPRAGQQRLVRSIFYVKDPSGINRYDRPIEGVSALIDLQKMRITEWRELNQAPVPVASSHFTIPYAKNDGAFATPTSAIPMVNGEVQWGNWRFMPMIHAREGLTLYDVRFVDNGKPRRIAYRMSLSEMLVPYGDTASQWAWRNAFDVGEYGFGQSSTQLRRGADVPDNALLREASFVEDNGKVTVRPDVLAIYERDAGIAWRHAVNATTISSQRGRELVIQHAAVIGNYDYIVSYVLSLDGSIVVDVGLTGIMLVKASVDSVYDRSGSGAQMFAHIVAPHVLAPSHQHYFNFRLDLDIEDTSNVVTEVDIRSPEVGEENAYANAMMLDEWDIRSEREGARDVSLKNARTWRVSSTKLNAFGAPTAYTIIPQSVASTFLGQSSLVRQRASFIEHQLFVTRVNPYELYSAGSYPNESDKDLGLPIYMANDERLLRKDVVLWYTMGVTHVARPEDWPVMPTSHATIKIVPTGFFVRNPLLDSPELQKTKKQSSR